MFRPLAAIVSLAMAFPAVAEESQTHRISFDAGKSSATVAGKVTGRDTVLYKLNAKNGQFLKVTFTPENPSTDYNIYIPGRGPGDEALHISAAAGTTYLGQLYKTGDHTIAVFLNRAAARRGESSKFELHVSVTDKAPAEEGAGKPAAEVPQKVIDDCLEALRKQVGQQTGMKVISARRGEASFIIDVHVDTAEKPWRCFHDGTKCTGTEYQGEG